MGSLVKWFKNISRISQLSVLSAVAISGLFVASAMSPTPSVTSTLPAPPAVKDPEPVITTKVETDSQPIKFDRTTVEDNTLEKGLTQLRTAGVDGVKTITYKVTLKDGVETDRQSSEEISLAPVTEVTAVGTYVAPVQKCNPNYSGCVPIASDVDCAGGSGNGPAYTYGPVQVIGVDVYGLDRDGDGLGCE